MKTVGRLGSFITKGVYSVSGSLHPFGGAVDIIVVEQPDGSFKSSPWYVRFGKFQGVLKANDKVVKISVNGVEANFHMYLDPRGEAYFLREVEEEEPVISPSSARFETDSLKILRPVRSEGYSSDSSLPNSGNGDDSTNGKIVVRSTSRRSKIMGIVFGRRSASTKDDHFQELDDGTGIPRMGSLERAEIAADLLELQWSTNLATSKSKKGSRLPPFSSSERLDGNLQADSINHEMQRLGSGKLFEGNGLEEQHTCEEMDVLPGFGTPRKDNGSNKVDSFIHREASQGLEVELDGVMEENHETLHFSGAKQEEVIAYSQSEALKITSQLLQEDMVNQQTVNFGWMADESLNLEMTKAVLDSDTPSATFTLKHPSVEAAESCCIENNSNHGNLSNQIEEEKYKFEPGVVSGGGIKPGLDLMSEIVSSASVSESSEEEHLLFGDLDEFRPNRVLDGSESPNSMHMGSTREVNGPSVELVSSSEKIVKRNAFGMETKLASSPIDVQEIYSLSGSEAGLLAESMPNISYHIDSLDIGLLKSSSYSLDLSSKPTEWTLRQHDSGSSHVNSGSVNQAVREHPNGEDLCNGNGVVVASTIWDPSKEPASQKQLGSRRTSQSALNAIDIANVENLNSPENDLSSSTGMNTEKDMPKAKFAKKLARVITPTSEQIASLNLQEGKNVVTFTFSTPMLGKQEVDARIFLWKWNTRVVISDVDGTITKSDVLGQFMPLVGVDWSQTGVANLFSAIKENGYQLLFLSARAISQAYLTRRFLCSLEQDGKTLPEGPVVISPDGLFPSLFREVIRRAPHEFKIACLEDIKALFPPDCQPFYAGFGNRDTDEISYVKVGIPKGKIFIINPKGEVSVHRRVDRKSYHSLHDLVHGMFPSTLTFEQEDFNSWNYWKLPSLFSDI